MQRIKILLITLTLTFGARGSTLFLPDSDTAALVALVSNTASTVSNTLKILEVAKETSSKIDEYNRIAMRRYFMARRIERHARDMAEISKMKPKGLREINQMLSRLKRNLKGLKTQIDFMAKDVMEAENFVDGHWERIGNSIKDEKEAHNQELASASEGSLSTHVQNTAMNTALTSKILSKKRRDDLQYQKHDLALKKNRELESLRREEFYRDWIGLKEKDSTGERP